MSKPDDDPSDEFVAGLLKREAEMNNSARSNALTSRSSPGLPRPNTRFLRNMVREVDTHNTALLARESSDSRQRLRDMSGHGGEDRARREGADNYRPREESREERKRGRRRSRDRDRDGGGERRHKRHHGSRSRSTNRYRYRSRSRDARRSRRDECRDNDRVRVRGNNTDHTPRHRRSHSRSRHRLRFRSRSRSPPRRRRASTPRPKTKNEDSTSPASDLLEEIVGPLPPARGRGESGMDAMDARFDEKYNPSLDKLQPDNDEDWDAAMEAYRDRQKWKILGAERLREAGYDESFIRRWENGTSLDTGAIQWDRKGGVREWDRGKVVENGEVRVRSAWAKKS